MFSHLTDFIFSKNFILVRQVVDLNPIPGHEVGKFSILSLSICMVLGGYWWWVVSWGRCKGALAQTWEEISIKL